MHGSNVEAMEQRQTFISLSLDGENLWCFENDDKKISICAAEHNAAPPALNTAARAIDGRRKSDKLWHLGWLNYTPNKHRDAGQKVSHYI